MSAVYTYKVTMVVEVIAKDKETALKILDEHGGYVTERKVDYMTTTIIPSISLSDSSKES
jgi:hypothetical protein